MQKLTCEADELMEATRVPLYISAHSWFMVGWMFAMRPSEGVEMSHVTPDCVSCVYICMYWVVLLLCMGQVKLVCVHGCRNGSKVL